MKNLLIVSILLTAAFTQSCKKGENDPFMSLKSRDARLTGEWELTSFEELSVYKTSEEDFDYFASESIVYSDGNVSLTGIETFTESGVVTDSFEESDAYAYNENITILKDGTFKAITTEDNDVHEYKSKWWWVDDVKSKTQISMDGVVYHVDRLTNKELVLIYSETEKGEQSDGQTSYTYELSENITRSYKKVK